MYAYDDNDTIGFFMREMGRDITTNGSSALECMLVTHDHKQFAYIHSNITGELSLKIKPIDKYWSICQYESTKLLFKLDLGIITDATEEGIACVVYPCTYSYTYLRISNGNPSITAIGPYPLESTRMIFRLLKNKLHYNAETWSIDNCNNVYPLKPISKQMFEELLMVNNTGIK